MAHSGGPRIGRPDRLAWLHERRAAEDALGLPTGMPAATRLLLPPLPIPATPRLSLREIQQRAAALAETLQPLPTALGEITTKISRHCGATTRDAELAQVVEAVRQRTWDLSLAVHRLAEAAGARS